MSSKRLVRMLLLSPIEDIADDLNKVLDIASHPKAQGVIQILNEKENLAGYLQVVDNPDLQSIVDEILPQDKYAQVVVKTSIGQEILFYSMDAGGSKDRRWKSSSGSGWYSDEEILLEIVSSIGFKIFLPREHSVV